MADELQPLSEQANPSRRAAFLRGKAMKKHRIWVEILVFGTLIACALAVLFATLGAVAGAAVTVVQPQMQQTEEQPTARERTFEGMVTCSRCGARHSAAIGKTADVCVRTCVHDGGSFVLVDADSTYTLEGDMMALKKLAGQRARIVGTLSGKTIKISSATSAI